MLSRISNLLATHREDSNGLAKSLWDSLNEYEAKLRDLRAALQEATAQAKQAADLNQDNEKTLEDIKVDDGWKSHICIKKMKGAGISNVIKVAQPDLGPYVWLYHFRPWSKRNEALDAKPKVSLFLHYQKWLWISAWDHSVQTVSASLLKEEY